MARASSAAFRTLLRLHTSSNVPTVELHEIFAFAHDQEPGEAGTARDTKDEYIQRALEDGTVGAQVVFSMDGASTTDTVIASVSSSCAFWILCAEIVLLFAVSGNISQR